MPIYEYRCEQCGFELEILQKINATAPNQCPQCQANALKRQVSAPQFKLKGTGWYETDFKTKPKTESSSTEKSTTADKKPDKKTDSE